MIARSARSSAGMEALGGRCGEIDRNVVLLIGLICFLLLWSFWGRDIRHSYERTGSLGIVGQTAPSPDMGKATASPRNSIMSAPRNGPSGAAAGIFMVCMFLFPAVLMAYLLYRHIVSRTAIVLSFAAAFVFLGAILGVYSPVDAFLSIKFDTISLILGMGIISAVLEEAGFFNRTAQKMFALFRESMSRIVVLFCIFSYCFSLFVNNLTTILVIVPMTLRLASILGFDPRPVIVGVIIAANIGGASTMIGDLPNMLIASETGIRFNEFIVFMMPVCLIQLAVLLVFIHRKTAGLPIGKDLKTREGSIKAPYPSAAERKATRKGLFVLCHCVALLAFSDKLTVNPSTIALCAGLMAFLFSGMSRTRVLQRVGFKDILYFVGLCVVVGGLEASGLLQYISRGIVAISCGQSWLLCLILMWTAACLCAFLNAGPTTLLFFPVVLGFTAVPSHHVVWWALSLGVLAGSSATVYGATSGPVAATLVEKFSSRYRLNLVGGNTLGFRQFTEVGLPIMLVFLITSSIYITWLCVYL